MTDRWENNGESERFYFGGTPKTLQMVTAAMKLKDTCSLEEKLWQTYNIKKQRHYITDKGLSSQSYGFSSSHVWMWELNYKEIWVLKNWCFWNGVLGKNLESPMECKETKPVNPKENQPLIFIHLMWRANSLEKILMLGKIEGRRTRGQQRMRWIK